MYSLLEINCKQVCWKTVSLFRVGVDGSCILLQVDCWKHLISAKYFVFLFLWFPDQESFRNVVQEQFSLASMVFHLTV